MVGMGARIGVLPAARLRSMAEQPELMTEQEMADYCRVSLSTAVRWRREGIGPPVEWAGSRPRYRKVAVDEWLARGGRDRSAASES
jgi:Helix-turn-helix domain